MRDIAVFVVLGVGAGAVNALLGLGLVTIYRGSGVLNFAHAAMGMYTAYVFVTLRQDWDWPLALSIAAALVVAAGLGLAVHLLVMHPLRHAPTLARVTGSLGVLLTLASLAYWQFGGGTRTVEPIVPNRSFQVVGVNVQYDRVLLFGVALVLTTALWALYRSTLFGLATRAAAESEKGAALTGYSQARLAAINWVVGALLAGVGGILISPIARLNALQLSLLIAPALAAALFGRFEDLWMVFAGGMLLGIGESLIGRYFNDIRGLTAALPFAIIVGVLILRGSPLPQRGELVYADMPFAPPVRRIGLKVGVFFVAAAWLLLVVPASYASAFSIALIGGVVILSLVVIVGWVGQISLAQMAFAGIGAYATARASHQFGVVFPFSILAGALVAVPVGVLVGLPALRVRGVNLAVVTLGAGLALERMVFNNPDLTSGEEVSTVRDPARIFGLALDGRDHPDRYGIVVLVVLCGFVLLMANLRRSLTGRQMLAVRADETAAASCGVNVQKVKLQAFAIAAFIAAVAGGLTAYRAGRVTANAFVVFQSINFFALAYIGGIATIGGSLVGTLFAPGAPFSVWLRNTISTDQLTQTLSGVGLIVTVVTQPDGLANAVHHEKEKRRIKAARRRAATARRDAPAPPAVPAPPEAVRR